MPYRFTPNMPVHVDIRFADLVGGQYGPQVKVKGTFDGIDDVAYLPGKIGDVLIMLQRSGVTRDMPNTMPDAEDRKGIALPVVQRQVVLTLALAAGEKYGTLVVAPNGAPTGSTQPPAPAAAASAPSASAAPALAIVADYFHVFDHVLLNLKARERDLAVNGERLPIELTAVNAMVATIFIQAHRR